MTTVRPPIFLIHGAFSQGAHFAAWAEIFSQAGYQCHAPSLPGHAPGDAAALAKLGLGDFLAALRGEIAKLSAPPILIGHSMGGLLAQQLAATAPCRALVCVASAPPWMLPAQIQALRFLLPLMPAILMGRSIKPSPAAFQCLALHDLADAVQRELLSTLGAESGRAYRAMIFGLTRLPGPRFAGPALCLSGGLDRIISRRTSAAIARLYGAQHEILEQRGHWLLAPSGARQVAGRIVDWLAQLPA